MKIKLLVPLSTDRASHAPDSVVDWPDAADAQRLISAGYAVEVKPVIEKRSK